MEIKYRNYISISVQEYDDNNKIVLSCEQLDALVWILLYETKLFENKYGKKGERTVSQLKDYDTLLGNFNSIMYLKVKVGQKKADEYLFSYNWDNAKSLINNGGMTGSFIDANGASVSFNCKTGKTLDYAMVQFEQTKVQDFITQYKNDNPNASMEDIMSSINYSMGSSFAPSEIKKVMNENFNPKNGQNSFDFGSYDDRVKLGQKIVDQLYE